MLKAKEELEAYLKKEIYKFLGDRERPKKICEYSKDTYDIPRTVTSDYLSLRKPLVEASDFILFCLLDSIENVNKQADSKIPYFFVDKEIKRYKSEKYHVDEIKFPIRFKVIEIAEDQWIGRIDFKMLMKLRAEQLINYNENAQRTMTKIIRGDDKAYKITLYEKSVAAIANSYKDETYIPTPITLTIPEESTADFYYDEEKCELVIKSIEHFDITDGYHRYVAACRVCDEDETLNYPMEIRISNWSESKAKHFVYQEDQKTKMRKIDSDALSSTDPANEICAKIKNKLAGNISVARNDGMIDESVLSEMIRCLCIRSNEKYDNKAKNIIRDIFVDAVLLAQDEYSIDLKTKWTMAFTVAFCLLAYTNRMNETLLMNITNTITEKKMLSGKYLNKTIVNRIRKEVAV